MSALWSDPRWGSWVLGDMPDTLRSVVDLLGGSVEIVTVTVAPPKPPAVLPRIQVVVNTTREVDALRLEVAQGEFVAAFDPDSGDEWWAADVAGVSLEVSLPEVAR